MVDAVNNNNNTAIYTGIGTVAGAAAGAGYGGWMSKPLLNKEDPSDAFVRRYYDNDAKDTIAKAGEDAKKALTESPTYKAAGEDVTKLTDIIKGNAKSYGLEAEMNADGTVKKSLDDVVKEFVGDADAPKLKEKMEKTVSDVATENATKGFKDSKKLAELSKDLKELANAPKAEELKAFVSKHAETLGVEADKVDDFLKKDITEIKELAKNVTKPLKDKENDLKAFIKDGKLNLEGAGDAVKKAAKDTKLWAGAKWAAGVGLALGIASYIGAKMTAPKVAKEEEQQTQAS